MQHISSACHLMRGGWLTWSLASRVATTLIYTVFIFLPYFFFQCPNPHPPSHTHTPVHPSFSLCCGGGGACIAPAVWSIVSDLQQTNWPLGIYWQQTPQRQTQSWEHEGSQREGAEGCRGRLVGGGGLGIEGGGWGGRVHSQTGRGRGGGADLKERRREWWNRKQVDARGRSAWGGRGTHTYTHACIHAHTAEMSSNQKFIYLFFLFFWGGGTLRKWKKMAASLQGSN